MQVPAQARASGGTGRVASGDAGTAAADGKGLAVEGGGLGTTAYRRWESSSSTSSTLPDVAECGDLSVV
jgi:hypothetical protein